MRRLVMSAMLGAVAVTFSSSAYAQEKDDYSNKVFVGRQVFLTYGCGTCHSIGPKGNNKGPLDGVGSKLSADELRSWIVNPVEMTAKTRAARQPLMLPGPKLNEEEIEGLVIYLQALKKK